MKALIVANWKMNPQTLTEAKKLFNSIKKGIKKIKKVELVICAPFVFLPALKVKGAQDCFWEERGAYTGEISLKMLKDLGTEYVIIGHSERRRYQKETDEMINKKIKAVISEGLKPILCIDKISQIEKDLKGISPKEFKSLVIAYEPLFAVGSGRPCPPERAERMRILIQKKMKKRIRIIYGGSVDSQNAQIYIEKAGFQGLLPGGASLKAKEFIKIARNVSQS
ncbi:MAG TPA: triose-phosphate isomerase [Candidatus Humimicrobiaceae bacterium]|nr:triose-phosphate isomerase [Candidatus Humimicrobiaceae bacterium]